MDIKDQKNTWEGFTKFVTISSIAIIVILSLMAFFLL
jgi:hypothetical protein